MTICDWLFIVTVELGRNGNRNLYEYVTSTFTAHPGSFFPGVHDPDVTPGGATQVVTKLILLGSSPMLDMFAENVVCTSLGVALQSGKALQLDPRTLAHRLASRAAVDTK